MKKSKRLFSIAIGALVLVNAGLVAAIFGHTAQPSAYAQTGGRIDVMAISVHYNTAGNPGPIAMLETHSGQLLLLRPTISGNAVIALDTRNCSDDISRLGK